ncbi:MAG: O-methyltransferase [Bryobacteraceae bacterium]|nr:O-methyltransferase [Bryobacteraceae bacterium]
MIVNPEIEAYIDGLLPARDPVLVEMEAYAAERGIPIIGPQVGRLLAQMVMATDSKRIFELGSAIGYSTIWLARAAGEGGEVHYSDGSAENARRAKAYFERAGVADRIQIHVGDALQALASTTGVFDFVFNDVDKEGYIDVLGAVPSRLRPGGIFATDNALWHERVLHPSDSTSSTIVEFNRKLMMHKDFFSTLIPLRDGVLIALKRRP